MFAGACGDDSPVGGGGTGGSTTTTTVTTGATSSTTNGSTTQTTNQSSSSTGLGGGDNDSCPGQNVTITPGNSITITGSTADAADDFTTFCGTGSSPDVVYEVELPGACSLSVQGTGMGGFNPIVSLRFQECDVRDKETLCSNGPAMVQHQDAGTVTLVVDGNDGASGDFSVEIECGVPTCGDLVVNPGEECDLGQGIPDDTCSDECTAEGAMAADTCAGIMGAPIPIPAGLTVLPEMDPWFNNAGSPGQYAGSCGASGMGARDQVFAFTPAVTGTLSIATALDLMGNPVCINFDEPECWFSFMYVRSGDCENGTELGCSFIDVNTGVHQLNNIAVTAGQTYYLFVDGLDDMMLGAGPYTLHFNLQ
jgi:cysteine-rich repeat protein